MNNHKQVKNNKGFTLVELLVVIAIIGILAAVIAPNAFRSVEKSKLTKVIQDCKAIEASALNHYADTGRFPEVYAINQPNMQDFLVEPGSGEPGAGSNAKEGWNGPYLERWPINPFNSGNLASEQDYQWDYRRIDGHDNFVVEVSLNGVENWTTKAEWIDRTIDNGDGATAGKIQWNNEWINWVAAQDAPRSGAAAH